MRIGNIEITGRAALAPMAGVTDAAYRRLCAQFGAAYTVTEMVSAKAIPYSYEKTARLLAETGCDLVMVGRGALGNPWVFRQINAYLTNSCTLIPPPGVAERIVVIKRHIDALCALKGEDRALREARKHVGWYLHGLRGAAQFRRRAGELCTLADLDQLLAHVYAANQGEG